MAYKALYRTYRPNTFEEVVGQKYIVTTLQNAVKQHKIAHAYLFCGPRGTGKTTIARLLAKAINCEHPEEAPCNTCGSCKMIQEGTHPDIVEIDGASYGRAENARDIIDKVKYAPLQGQYKVYIIDEVHMLTDTAFNALLKTLEEPPAHVVFVLATTEPLEVLPTIISRCQRFDFTKVDQKDIQARMRMILEAEKITYEPAAIELISELAEGGVRDALSILDQVIAYAQSDIKTTHVYEIYGITTPTEKYELIQYVLREQTHELLNLTGHIMDNGMDIKRLTGDLMEILKECVIYGYTKDADLLQNIETDKAESILNERKPEELLRMIDVLMEATDHYRFAANINTSFEVALLKMMTLNKLPSPIAEPKKREKKEEITQTVEPVLPVTKPITEKQPEDTVQSPLPESKKFEESYLLQLLVSADKKKREDYSRRWERIKEFTTDLRYARYANQLKDCLLGACGDGYALIYSQWAATADLLNEAQEEVLLAEFTKELFAEPLKLYALSVDEFNELVNRFKECKANNTLPEPLAMTEKNEQPKKKKTDATEEKLTELFGEGMFDVIGE